MSFLSNKWIEYKAVLGVMLLVASATVGVLVWADDAQQEAITIMKAESSIIHNSFYQEGRIARKEDQINENKRELNNLLKWIGDDSPTTRQDREINYLDTEISRLRKEIEVIRVTLAQ